MMESAAPKKINKYDVVDLIGRGGMGVVYKAVDRSLDRLVAIKMVTSTDDESGDLVKRFHREAQFTANLHHPNIVTVYDQGDFEGRPYLVMEYLAGQSLESMLARQPMTLQQRIGYIRQVCNGLQYAHTRQPSIIHRDIKPANIVVLDDGTVKIVDFGIARLGQTRHTRSGQLMGSYHYMSPEQITNSDLDGRTDIFSAGVVLYQLLTLTLPFEGGGIANTLHRIANSPPPPLGQFLKEYPARLDDIMTHALAKSRHDRYQSANEFAFNLLEVEDDLKRRLFGGYMDGAENLLREGKYEQARQELIQVLDVDRQHTRANELMREVQQAIARQQRKSRARELRLQAEEALRLNRMTEALSSLDQAVKLDNTDNELRSLRDEVATRQARAEKINEVLGRAERAYATNDLDGAGRAVDEALKFDPDSARAKSFKSIIETKLAERDRDRQVQDLLTSARRQIGNRQFDEALKLLRSAEKLNPDVTGLRGLVAAADSGQKEALRQTALAKVTAEISDALERGDLALARDLLVAAQEKFPDEPTLSKTQLQITQQMEAGRRRSEFAAIRALVATGQLDTAESRLRTFRREPGAGPEVQQLEKEIRAASGSSDQEKVEAARSEAQRLVGCGAYIQARALLESVAPLIQNVPPELQERLEQLKSVILRRSEKVEGERIPLEPAPGSRNTGDEASDTGPWSSKREGPREQDPMWPAGNNRRPSPPGPVAHRKDQLQDPSVAELTPLDGIPFPQTIADPSTGEVSAQLSSLEAPARAPTAKVVPPADAEAPPEPVSRAQQVSGAPGPAAAMPSSQESAWSDDVLRTIERQLAAYVGPLAKIVVKRAASRTTDPDEFYDLLAASIEQRSDRLEFLSRRILKSSGRPEPPRPESDRAGTTNLASQAELTPAELERATRILARYVGPLAGVLVGKAARRADNLRTLYKILAQHVETEPERTHFLREARFPDL